MAYFPYRAVQTVRRDKENSHAGGDRPLPKFMNALILNLTKIHDTDAIVDLLTDADMPVHAYAKNYRTSRHFPNGLELFSVYEVSLSASNNGHYWFNSAHSEQPFSKIVSDVTSYACASAILETVNVAYADETPMPNLFKTLLQAFAAMEAAPDLSPLIHAWLEAHVLFVQHILPDIRLCSGCAAPLDHSAYFQQEQGFLCTTCARGQENLPERVLSGLRRLISAPLRAVLASAVQTNAPEARHALLHGITRLLACCLRDFSTRRTLRAHAFLGETVYSDPFFLEPVAQ